MYIVGVLNFFFYFLFKIAYQDGNNIYSTLIVVSEFKCKLDTIPCNEQKAFWQEIQNFMIKF